ncbi:hypothetical protein OESDEN_07844 [Oesophagostomum dentatum]|uniref:VWFA domain-containing protein n=1 Tax=Oesophagostomum dentatum TaxID=61180 RepID=A0A0B1T8Z2_OESDE|nr:hypothetical protein OESDEN_07844 [Oesophagostomum dentatum]
MATKDLYGAKNRTHVPKVIVIVASADHEKDLYEPNKDEAEDFKRLGGHIITIGEVHAEPIQERYRTRKAGR